MSLESSARSSPLKKLSHLISESRLYPIVCGLLGTPDPEDQWTATDLVGLRELIGDPDSRNIWLCVTSICFEKFLLGDTAFETVCEQPLARLKYLFEVKQAALSSSEEDVLVLVLAGHGEPDGVFTIGDDCKLKKGELEWAVCMTKATVWLIITACYSKGWESPKWSLFASREADKDTPSFAGGETSCSSASVTPVDSSLPHSPGPGSVKPTVNLSSEDEKQLISLAQDLLRFRPIQTARETPTIVMCYRLIRGCNPLTEAEKSRLFLVLKERKQYQELAVAIARNLGWGEFIDKLGRPDREQAHLSVMFNLQRKAEASGCLVSILNQRHSLGRYAGAAGWLARIWEAAGSPSIASLDWTLAVEQSHCIL